MPLELTIVTPEREVFRGSVLSVVLPGAEGDFGVLPGHERFLCPLRIGEASIRTADGASNYAALSDGFAEVTGERVIVMVGSCELASEIDVARAELARAQAERDLERLRTEHVSDQRLLLAETALQRALVRLSAAKRS